ncbi:hypothetical protein OQA88_12302 [Cercophora sp. LCS_1]
MLATPPTLYIHRPSPTTAHFTVTTRPPPTLPLRALLLTLTAIRFLLSLTLSLTLYIRFSTPSYSLPHLSNLLSHPSAAHLVTLITPLPAWAVLGVTLPLLWLSVFWQLHTTESLLVLRGLGIQTSTTGEGLFGAWRPATRFIATEKIRDVLINEAFRGLEVRYYLVVVVEGEEDVVVVFPRLLPRRRIVEAVWRGVGGCLYEDKGEGGGYFGRKD